MADYPIVVDLFDRLCVVVGGGAVGLRKVRGLMGTGARIRLVSRDLGGPLPASAEIEILHRDYRPEDLRGAFMVFAATGSRKLNDAILDQARQEKALCCVVDRSNGGDFHLPAILHRGNLQVAVSSSGTSPALSAVVRNEVARLLPASWEVVGQIATALRGKRLTGSGASAYNRANLQSLIDRGLLALIEAGDAPAVDGLLQEVLGPGTGLTGLGVQLPKGTS